MDEELVLLTSYFNLLNGRRQDTAGTFRVDPDVASATAPDGTAALYVVTEASTAGQMGPRARRLAANTVAWEYAARDEEPPPSRIKGALRAADDAVRQEYDGHVAVGMSIIAVEGDTVYLGQVAPAQVYVLHEGSLHSIAATGGSSAPFSQAIGSTEGAQISVFRDQVGPGDVLALCSSWFHQALDADDLRECFSAATAEEITDGLLQLARSQDATDVTAIVIEAVPAAELDEASGETLPGFMDQVDNAVQSLAGVGRMLWTELRAVPPPPPRPSNGKQQEVAAHPVQRPKRSITLPWKTHTREAAVAEPPAVEEPLDRVTGEPPEDYVGAIPVERPHQNVRGAEPVEPPEPVRDRGAYRHQATEEIPIIGPNGTSPADEITGEIPIIPDYSAPGPGSMDGWAPGPTAPEYLTEAEAEALGLEPDGHTERERTVDEESQAALRGRSMPRSRSGATPVSKSVAEPDMAPEAVTEASADGEAGGGAVPVDPDVDQEPESTARPAARPSQEPMSELDQVNSRLLNGPDMGGVVPPIQAFPDTSVQPERIYATSKDIQAVNKRPRRFGGMARPVKRDPLDGPAVIRPTLDNLGRERPATRPSSPMFVWAGIAVVFLLAAGSIYLLLHHHHAIAVNPYPALVSQDITRAAHAGTARGQDYYLARAHHNLTLAARAGATASQMQQLRQRLLSTEDRLYGFTPVTNPVVLAGFAGMAARPAEVATAPGLAFVLDSGRKKVLSVKASVSGSNPTTIVHSGEVVSGFTIGTPKQIATAGTTALVFDDHNILVRYQNGARTATALTEPDQGEKIVAMSTEDPDVYLLDRGSSQVWRYPAATTAVNPTAMSYFGAAAPPHLQHAVSLAMDGTDMYILLSNGTVLKYDNFANARKFTIHLRTPLRNPTIISTASGLPDLWIADPAQGRIVQINKSGGYVRSYVSRTASMNLHNLKAMAIGPAGNTLYVVVGSKLLDFTVTP